MPPGEEQWCSLTWPSVTTIWFWRRLLGCSQMYQGSGMQHWQHEFPFPVKLLQQGSLSAVTSRQISRPSHYHLISDVIFHGLLGGGGEPLMVGTSTQGVNEPSRDSLGQKRVRGAEFNYRIKLLSPLVHEVIKHICLPHSLREDVEESHFCMEGCPNSSH